MRLIDNCKRNREDRTTWWVGKTIISSRYKEGVRLKNACFLNSEFVYKIGLEYNRHKNFEHKIGAVWLSLAKDVNILQIIAVQTGRNIEPIEPDDLQNYSNKIEARDLIYLPMIETDCVESKTSCFNHVCIELVVVLDRKDDQIVFGLETESKLQYFDSYEEELDRRSDHYSDFSVSYRRLPHIDMVKSTPEKVEERKRYNNKFMDFLKYLPDSEFVKNDLFDYNVLGLIKQFYVERKEVYRRENKIKNKNKNENKDKKGTTIKLFSYRHEFPDVTILPRYFNKLYIETDSDEPFYVGMNCSFHTKTSEWYTMDYIRNSSPDLSYPSFLYDRQHLTHHMHRRGLIKTIPVRMYVVDFIPDYEEENYIVFIKGNPLAIYVE